jgi:AraC-like DNA-binding protein
MNLFYYRHNTYQKQEEMPLNQISFHEITIVLDGKLEYTVDDTPYSVEKGDIIYLKKGSIRRRKPIENSNYVSLNFYSDEVFDFPVLFKDGASDILRSLLRALDGIYQYTANLKDERFPILLQSVVLQLKAQLKAEREHPLVSQIKRFVKNNLDKKLNLETIGGSTFFSPIYCEKVFKKETGKSIIDYILDERIAMSKTLLREGSFPLAKIAEIVGFSDYNYFSRTFKKRTGYTPTQYKKSISEH